MLFDFWLATICFSNVNTQRKDLNDIRFNRMDSFSKNIDEDILNKKGNQHLVQKDILFETETEIPIFSTSQPGLDFSIIMLICYASGILFFLFTIFLTIFAIFKCRHHDYHEI